MKYLGSTKLILKYLGFLESEYGMKFNFQTFKDFQGFYGPIDTYSFHNESGCFTLHNIVQKGEWGWYVCREFSTDQYALLKREINQKAYIKKRCWTTKALIKELSQVIKNQIACSGCFFGIKMEDKKQGQLGDD